MLHLYQGQWVRLLSRKKFKGTSMLFHLVVKMFTFSEVQVNRNALKSSWS